MLTPIWAGCACALVLIGCAAQVEPTESDVGSAKLDREGDPEPTPASEPPIALEDAPTTRALLAGGIEPIALEIAPDIARGLLRDKKVIGDDSRMPVANTSASPYATIAGLLITFPSGRGTGLCTGSLIGSDAVLTAGHCVYNPKRGGFARSIRVIPGMRPDAAGRPSEPFGSSSGSKLYTPSAYRFATTFWEREPHDYAVIRTQAPIGAKTGLRKFGVMAAPAVGRAVTLVGYHGDLCRVPPCAPSSDAYVMYSSHDSMRKLPADGVFNHYADSMPGSSGSPMVSDGVDANRIFAVHVAGLANPNTGAEWNMGVLITKGAFANIQSWVAAP